MTSELLRGQDDQMDMRDQFRRALDDFKKKAELTSEELQYFQLSCFNDVLKTLDQVQKEQSKKKTLVFMKRIDPFLKTMGEYGKVIEVFVNTSEILAFVWVSLHRAVRLTPQVRISVITDNILWYW